MAKKNDYQYLFTQKNTAKPTIKVGDKIFKINNRSVVMRFVNEEYRKYTRVAKEIQKYADMIDKVDENDTDKMFEIEDEILGKQNEMSEISDKIITLLLGEEANTYIDDELEMTFEDKQELSNVVYSMATGQTPGEDEEVAEDGENFRK